MGIKICLDAGHYGKYNRSKVVPSYYESEMNWKLHNFLASALEAYGIGVVKTRTEQAKDLGLTARGKKAKDCDLFLSIHSNACDSESVDYPLVVTMQDGKGDKLGLAIAKKIQELMGTTQAGKITKKKGTFGGEWYSVLEGARQVGVMGMIIEHSFHTNTKATKWLLEDSNLKKMAEEEAALIAEHFGLTHKEDKPNVEIPSGKYCIIFGDFNSKDEAEAVAAKLKDAGFDAVILADDQEEKAWEPKVGDTVKFTGCKQYPSSDSDTVRGAVAGLATITAHAAGNKHPWHLVRTGDTGPYGWVDAGTFTKA